MTMGKSSKEAVAELTKKELLKEFKAMPLEYQQQFPQYEQQLDQAKTSKEALVINKPVYLLQKKIKQQ